MMYLADDTIEEEGDEEEQEVTNQEEGIREVRGWQEGYQEVGGQEERRKEQKVSKRQDGHIEEGKKAGNWEEQEERKMAEERRLTGKGRRTGDCGKTTPKKVSSTKEGNQGTTHP